MKTMGARKAKEIAEELVETKRNIARERVTIRTLEEKAKSIELILLPYIQSHGSISVRDATVSLSSRESNSYVERYRAMVRLLFTELPARFRMNSSNSKSAQKSISLLDSLLKEMKCEVERIEEDTHRTSEFLSVKEATTGSRN